MRPAPETLASAAAPGAGVACPACHSAATVTTAKRPDADSYWRCTACGNVWNVARSQTRNDRYHERSWR